MISSSGDRLELLQCSLVISLNFVGALVSARSVTRKTIRQLP